MNKEMKGFTGVEIAIIGMSGKFPGAADINQFWQNLKNGVESISFFEDKELLEEGEDKDRLRNARYVRCNAYLSGKEYFDSNFFGYRPEEAALMNPQQRIFHEVCWSALEDAGYDVWNNQEKIGLFAGGNSFNINWENYSIISNMDNKVDNFTSSQLSGITYLCSKVSYLFNLQGPSIFVNTACSTSLVAVQRACMSLLLRECTMALAGGVSVYNYTKRGYLYEEGMIASKDGHCRTFDESCSGTVVGEGAGVVVLKRLADAIKDGDNIHAVIRGSAVNNDGLHKVSYSAPSVEGQYKVILKAMKVANVEPESISYVEAHGTGTRLGDPIEVEALNNAFGKSNERYCALGSVKTNIGHLDAAAGIAGLIKTVLALKYKQVPPSLHFKTPNPAINFSQSPFYVSTELREWKNEKYPLRAGVSSFGIGGTNAHVILEEAPALDPVTGADGRDHLLVMSGKTPTALEGNLEKLKDYFIGHPQADLGDVAYTLQIGRTALPYRKAMVCRNSTGAIECLTETQSKLIHDPVIHPEKSSVVFMFSGQGSQYANMFYDLYKTERVFQHEVDACFDTVLRVTGKNIMHVVFPGNESENGALVNQTEFTQPLLFIMEYALAKLLMSWGINPDAMIGHSIGEYVAACLSGVFSRDEALMLVVKRGELMQSASHGLMLSISISEDDLKKIIDKKGGIDIAAINATDSCVVAGNEDTILAFRTSIEEAGYKCKIIATSHAFHSWMMDDIIPKFDKILKTINWGAAKIPFLSNLSGEFVTEKETCDSQYWLRHLRNTVRFEKGINKLFEQKNSVFIEVGPGKALSSLVRSNKLRMKGHKVVSLVRSEQENTDDYGYLLRGIGELWLSGISIKWRALHADHKRRKVSLPTYAFDKIKYPVNVDAFKMISDLLPDDKLKKHPDIKKWFYVPSWKLSTQAPGNSEIINNSCILIFTDDFEIGEKILDALPGDNRVVRVKKGIAFAQLSTFLYEVNPANDNDYDELFSKLDHSNMVPECVINCWGLNNLSAHDEQQSFDVSSFHGLIHIARSWQRRGAGILQKRLILITNDLYPIAEKGTDRMVNSLPVALLRVISQEYPSINVSHGDISLMEEVSQTSAEILCREIFNRTPGNLVSLRNGISWERIYDRFPIAENVSCPQLKENGVYLITGGLGNFGFALARHLLKLRCRVVLLGRTPVHTENVSDVAFFDDNLRNRSALSKSERLGLLRLVDPRLIYIQCDVSDLEEMKQAIQTIQLKVGNINGVIHAAGNTGEQTSREINKLSDDDFAEHFAPKIYGLKVLKKILSGVPLDFCLVTSSLSTVLGGLGFGAYAPANIFCDQYITKYSAKGELKNWISVNFDGIDFDSDFSQSITSDEIFEVFKRILTVRNRPQILVSASDLDNRLKLWVNKENGDSTIDVAAVSFAQGSQTATDTLLQSIWEHFFGRPNLDVDDDFFEIGGDSLKALTIIGRLHKSLGVEIPISDFFNNSSIRKLGAYIDLIKESVKDSKAFVGLNTSLNQAEEKQYYRLSSVQKRMYFLHVFDKTSLWYNQPQVLRLSGRIDHDRMTAAFRQLIARHDMLRTSFHLVNDELVQVVSEQCDFSISTFESNPESAGLVLKNFIVPFNLSIAPLIRVGLIWVGQDEHMLVVDMPHIVTDSVSQDILINDFTSIYSGDVLPLQEFQYKDYSEWQYSDGYRRKVSDQRVFWMREFSVLPAILELPTDSPRPSVKSHRGALYNFSVDSDRIDQLRSISERQGATMFMTFLSAFNILLSKLGNCHDIVVGIPTAGRPHQDLEKIIGMFADMLACRNKLQADLSFERILESVKSKTLACYENQFFPYDELVDELKMERTASRNPLFDVVFSYASLNEAELHISGLRVEPFSHSRDVSKFDLTLFAIESPGGFEFSFEYSLDLFKRSTIERFARAFCLILDQVVLNPKITLSEIEVVNVDDRSRISELFDRTDIPYNGSETIVEVFERQVRLRSQSIAVEFHDEAISYASLNARSNQLAHYLIESGVTTDTIVGLYMERSIDLVVSILAVIKAGGAYLPLDIDAPAARTGLILTDSSASFLIMTSRVSFEVDRDLSVIVMDEFVGKTDQTSNPVVSRRSDGLCYVIYTSGTTGLPKGVMIDHRNLMGLFFNDSFYFDFNEHDVWTMFHRYCFDFSVWEMYGALLFGGKLILISKSESIDPSVFVNILREKRVTVLNQTPTAFHNLMEKELMRSEADLGVRYVIFGGEALNPKILHRWYLRYPNTKLINMFGITETTVHVTYKEIGEKEILENQSNIGRALPSVSNFIFDRDFRFVIPGLKGELYVGGSGVARGYLNNVELTHARFVPNPYNPGQRLYRSGDLARIDSGSDLEYHGRIDNQIQLKGFRIELGEIENSLLGYRFIKDAKVTCWQRNEDRFLLAYYISSQEISVSHLRKVLSESLPLYMIPSFFIRVDSLPLSENGKVNYDKLPLPETAVSHGDVMAPTKLHLVLSEIWARILGLNAVSVDANFFALGGDSILAIRVVDLINRYVNVNIRIADLYDNQTIAELAAFVEGVKPAGLEAERILAAMEITQFQEDYIRKKPLSGVEGVFPMSDIEKGMCYVQLKNPQESIYYEQLVLNIYHKDFDISRARFAIFLLTQKHEALRTAFDLGEFAHIVYRALVPDVPFMDLTALSSEDQEQLIRDKMSEYDPAKVRFDHAPLWKMSLFKLAADHHCLLFENHHAISDGWSIASLTNELNNLYAELTLNAEFRPRLLKSGYKDFILEEVSYSKNAAPLDFWRQELDGFKKFTFGKHSQASEYRSVIRRLDSALYAKVEDLAALRKTSVKSVFFAAYMYTLKAMSFEDDIVSGLVTFNRPTCEDGDRIFGNFLNIIPVRVKLRIGMKAHELLDIVDKKLLSIRRYDKTSLFSINRALGAAEYGENPITDILFNFTNFHSLYELNLEAHSTEQSNLRVNSYIRGQTLFDVNVNGSRSDCYIQYAYVTSFIDDYLFEKFDRYYQRILNLLVSFDELPLSTHRIVGEDEYFQLTHAFNNTDTIFPSDKSIVDLFKASVERTPSAIAVVSDEGQVTFAELDRKSSVIAKYIRTKVNDQAVVAISLDRSLEMIIAILGILKANCIYMPVDPGSPRSRNEYMLDDLNVHLIITDEKLSSNFGSLKSVVNIHDPQLYSEEPGDFSVCVDPAAIAYILYTSGSTGRPKGVAISHRSVVNRLHWMQKAYPITEADVILQKTPFTFDVSVWELFWWSFQGAKLAMLGPGEEKSPQKIVNAIEKWKVTTIHFVPSMLSVFVGHVESEILVERKPRSLKYIFASGEALMPPLARKCNGLFSETGVILVNLYGPTEATVDVTHFVCPSGDTLSLVPIGKPIHNHKMHILDKNHDMLPIGLQGELCISGVGLSYGYVNRLDLTRDKFIPNPLQPECLVYKTGDFARWCEDGNIEYLGRMDNQVKVRGNRVELGEIEHAIASIAGIDRVVVIAENINGENRLLAYYTSEQSQSSMKLKGVLRKKLPEYMIPFKLIQIDEMPVTTNGKADRKVLLEMHRNDEDREKQTVAPSTPIELELARIWCEEIGVDKICMHDSFFDIGGHSLSAIKTASRLKEKYGVEPNFANFFNQTFAQFVYNYEAKLTAPEVVESGK